MRPSFGALLLASLVLLNNGCRNSTPPPIDICIGDGSGGADCVLRPGSPLALVCMKLDRPEGVSYWCSPSKLENAWITTQQDMAEFSAWCYDIDRALIEQEMQKIRTKALR